MSVVAMLAYNYFFLPPVGTFTIADPQNWVALIRVSGDFACWPASYRLARATGSGRGNGAPARSRAAVQVQPATCWSAGNVIELLNAHSRANRGDI